LSVWVVQILGGIQMPSLVQWFNIVLVQPLFAGTHVSTGKMMFITIFNSLASFVHQA